MLLAAKPFREMQKKYSGMLITTPERILLSFNGISPQTALRLMQQTPCLPSAHVLPFCIFRHKDSTLFHNKQFFFPFFNLLLVRINENAYICNRNIHGALAHQARAFDWQSKGGRFESCMLHNVFFKHKKSRG